MSVLLVYTSDVHAPLIRLTTLEMGQKQIDVYHYLHGQDDSVSYGSQINAMHFPGAQVLVEMAPQPKILLVRSLYELLHQLTTIFSPAVKHESQGHTSPSLFLYALAHTYHYALDQSLLYQLQHEQCGNGTQVTAIDSRILVMILCDFIILTSLLPYFRHVPRFIEAIKYIEACPVLVHEFFTYMHDFLSEVITKTRTINKNTRSQETATELIVLEQELLDLSERAHKLEQVYTFVREQRLVALIRQRGEKLPTGHTRLASVNEADIAARLAAVLGEDLVSLMQDLSSSHILMWTLDVLFLAHVQSGPRTSHYVLITGASHGDHLVSLFHDEGYRTLNDSLITLGTQKFHGFDQALSCALLNSSSFDEALTYLNQAIQPIRATGLIEP